METLEDVGCRYDVVVVGARCAGAATAMLLARRGARVLLVERAPYGTDALSTHALMRAAVVLLSRWGLLETLVDEGTPALRETAFVYGDERLDVPIRAKGGIDALYAPRRTLLDRVLVDAAARAGATVVHGVAVTELLYDGDRVAGVTLLDARPTGRPTHGTRLVEAGLVVGADGLRSTVARCASAPLEKEGEHAAAFAYAHLPSGPERGFEWYYRPGVSAGVIPTNGGQSCVFVSTTPERYDAVVRPDARAGFARLVEEVAPLHAARAREAMRARLPVRAFRGARGFLRRGVGPGWALVGDAGYFKDPITAHGITDAFRDAHLLASAASEGTARGFEAYAAARRELSTGMLEVTDAIASFAWTLDEVKSLHERLKLEMKRELDAVTSWSAGGALAA